MLTISLTFLALAVVVAGAGVFLARAADQIAEITGLGRLLVGSVLLAAATSLPELTVDISAIQQGMPDLAAGDLLGSCLMNLMILAVLDLVHRSAKKMLSREAAAHALSATLSVALAAIVGMAIMAVHEVPEFTFLNIGAWTWGILIAYLFGVRMVFLDQRISMRAAAEAAQGDVNLQVGVTGLPAHAPPPPMWKPVVTFALATAVLVLVGPRLAETAGELAELSGLGKSFVGTTLVALCTSLPELVASITAIRMKAIDLVIGNVFGSNAFNMVLFLPLDAMHDGQLFAAVSPLNALTALAVILATSVAILGQLYRVEKRKTIIEPDALLMLLILLGALALVYRLSTH